MRDVAEAFRQRDFTLERGVDRVAAIEPDTATRIAGNIDAYGATLTSLPDETWDSSVCMWQVDYWEVLVDLFTAEEGRSDLVMFARVYEQQDGYGFEITSVHVP